MPKSSFYHTLYARYTMADKSFDAFKTVVGGVFDDVAKGLVQVGSQASYEGDIKNVWKALHDEPLPVPVRDLVPPLEPT